MKTVLFFLMVVSFPSLAQTLNTTESSEAILRLIKTYSDARESQDSVLLKSILTDDVDQLVSSGEWRTGVDEAVKGMKQSSSENPGTRTLHVERIRFITPDAAIVDARYEIEGPNGGTRKMWSSFVVYDLGAVWKISAIRNMMPTGR